MAKYHFQRADRQIAFRQVNDRSTDDLTQIQIKD